VTASVDVRSERVRQLVDEDVEIEQVASGFAFTEGPIWVPGGEYLLFSDVRADRRYRWDEAGGARVVAEPMHIGNGMTLDTEGRLIVCETVTQAVVRMDASGTGAGREVLASQFEGKTLNSPNDVVVASDGSIYFSDPWTAEQLGLVREPQLEVQGVYRLAPDGQLELVVDDFARPNGLCFSPDESILYVDDTTRHHIRAFDVAPDGSLTNDRLLAVDVHEEGIRGGVDGIKCDERGNVWVKGPHGIWIYGADGEHLGMLLIPERAANLHWGGPDWNWLFVTASTSVYRVRTNVTGSPEPFMRR
jgi:gluconolactonase